MFAGEDPLLIDFDEAAAAPELRAALGALLRVELEVVAPDARGQPSAPEARQLAVEEEELIALLVRHETGGRLVARTSSRGVRELILALPAPGRADFVLRKWFRKLEREHCATALDEGWSFVDRHILPGPSERVWMAARDAVLRLLEQGTEPSAQASLEIEGRPAQAVPLDPFHIAAELEQAGPSVRWELR